MTRRLRYVCQADGCDEAHVTARGHAVHANRAHADRVESKRRWIDVDD